MIDGFLYWLTIAGSSVGFVLFMLIAWTMGNDEAPIIRDLSLVFWVLAVVMLIAIFRDTITDLVFRRLLDGAMRLALVLTALKLAVSLRVLPYRNGRE